MFILGGFAISSGLLTIAFLPETLGAGLPEVISNSTNFSNLNIVQNSALLPMAPVSNSISFSNLKKL